MNIILPPGSTSIDLQAAIDSAASGDSIIISGNMPFIDTDTIAIPNEKEITIQSDNGNNWVMSQASPDVRHFDVRGNLILQNITLDGGNSGGGVRVNTYASFTMNEGAVIQNCSSTDSGGGVTASSCNITMNEGAVIQNCSSDRNGGGICTQGTTTDIYGGIIRNNISINGFGGGYFGGILTMYGGTISGNKALGGGGVSVETFTMKGGTISGNEADYGGGVNSPGYFTLEDGIISGNKALLNEGGGVMVGYGVANINGGIISDNEAFAGGGIAVRAPFTINECVIRNNKAANGGGIIIYFPCTISGSIISGNMASSNGGGICVGDYTGYSGTIINMSECEVSGNAAAGNGGGIYVKESGYGDLITDADTVFACNRASTAYAPPKDAVTLYPDIMFAVTTITEHPLNNYDINYIKGAPINVNYNVNYNANGGIGSYIGPDIGPCETDKILFLDETGISRPGYTFIGWNTQPNGGGTTYTPGTIITLTDNIMLYAQWAAISNYNVIYGANGGSGGYIDSGKEFELYYIILSTSQTGISRSGYTFIGWNTSPDGSGISYAQGDIITIYGDVTLYAQWRQFQAQQRRCRAPVMKCRTSIEGQKLWIDNDNAGNTRPPSVEIILIRDGEVYKRVNVDSAGDGYFGFCCIPVWKNTNHKYSYQIDETTIPGYTKTIERYTIINTLTP